MTQEEIALKRKSLLKELYDIQKEAFRIREHRDKEIQAEYAAIVSRIDAKYEPELAPLRKKAESCSEQLDLLVAACPHENKEEGADENYWYCLSCGKTHNENLDIHA